MSKIINKKYAAIFIYMYFSTLSTPAHAISLAYEVFDLGALGGSSSEASAINDAGQVTGQIIPYYQQPYSRAFLWNEDTGMASFGMGPSNSAAGINNLGQIVGTSTPNGSQVAFLADSRGVRELGTLEGWGSSAGNAINDSGEIVGHSSTATGLRAFLWDESKGMRDLGSLGGYSMAYGINNLGQVVGSSATVTGRQTAFLWDNSTGMRSLGTLGSMSSALGINNSGEVIGYNLSGGNFGAFIWDEQNGMHDIGTFGGSTFAYDINDKSQIVGMSVLDHRNRAFLWQKNTGMLDLNSLISPQDSHLWSLEYAMGINIYGQIVGRGTFGSATRAFLLNPIGVGVAPVPLPTTLPLFAAAIVGIGATGYLRHRKKSTTEKATS